MNRENKRARFDKHYYTTHQSQPFTCKNCGKPVGSGAGSEHRNHCPYCLWSIHLDNTPGDRSADCHGKMQPIGVWVRKGGEWAVVHRCTVCGKISSNRIAADDNPSKLVALALKPFACNKITKNDINSMISSLEE